MHPKVGRNDPCPCGSGRKYKMCHLNKSSAQEHEFSTLGRRSENPSITVDAKDVGSPGTFANLHAVARLPEEKRSDDEILRDRSNRIFEMHGFFSKGELEKPNSNFKIEANPENGSSFLLLPEGPIGSRFHTPYGTYELSKNSKNEVSMFSLKVKASSGGEAVNIFIKGISPILDHWSYDKNLPFFIDRIICLDKKNNVQSLTCMVPYEKVSMGPSEGLINERLLPVYSLYREAKNTNSVYYKFLCLAKILEGIYKRIRPETYRLLKQVGIESKGLVEEKVPSERETEIFFKDKIGQPIQQLYETFFQEKYRDALAHFTLVDSTPLWLSDHGTWAEYSTQVTLLEICCRKAIRNEEMLQNLLAEKMRH